MAIKHQGDCYRTINGTRWPNLCDVMNEADERDIRGRKAEGQRIRMIRHPDGYYQAFIHPDDLKGDDNG